MRRELTGLTGVRGVAAAWVVVFHASLLVPALHAGSGIGADLVASGGLGVDLFFILSGFVISYTYADRLAVSRTTTPGVFYAMRVARIYPAHLATLLAAGGLALGAGLVGVSVSDPARYTPLDFVMNALMLQAVPPAISWNDPAWSISTEFAAYLVFPLLARGTVRLSERSALALAVVVLAVGALAVGVVVATAFSWPYWAGYALMWLRIAVCFPVGCLLHAVWRSRPPEAWARVAGPVLLVGLLGALATAALAPQPEGLRIPAAAYPFLALVVFGAAAARGRLERIAGNPVLRWLGRVSYSIYLAHFLVLLVVRTAIDRWMPELPPVVVALVVAGAVLLGGWLLYLTVEEPCRRAIAARVRRRSTLRRGDRTPARS